LSVFKRDLIKLVPALHAYALGLSGRLSDADDLVQETLEKAWRAQAQFQPDSCMKAWLFTILRNSHHGHGRRLGRVVEDRTGQHAGRLQTEPIQLWHLDLADVLRAMSRLEPESLNALLLVASGLSYEETAAVCGAPLRTVQSRVRRARLKLAHDLGEPLT